MSEIYTGEHNLDPRMIMIVDQGSLHYPTFLLQAQVPASYVYHNGETYVPVPIPDLLQVRGTMVNSGAVPIAIIGTRQPSSSGISMATGLGSLMAYWGRPVVSGLAIGIDQAAHTGVLRNHGIPLAVLGHNILRVRSPLAQGITYAGALISQFLDSTINHPIRNQTIVNMSGGIIIPEAGLGGGTHGAALYSLACGKPIAICRYKEMPKDYIPFFNELKNWANVTVFGSNQELAEWVATIAV